MIGFVATILGAALGAGLLWYWIARTVSLSRLPDARFEALIQRDLAVACRVLTHLRRPTVR